MFYHCPFLGFDVELQLCKINKNGGSWVKGTQDIPVYTFFITSHESIILHNSYNNYNYFKAKQKIINRSSAQNIFPLHTIVFFQEIYIKREPYGSTNDV